MQDVEGGGGEAGAEGGTEVRTFLFEQFVAECSRTVCNQRYTNDLIRLY